MNRPPFPRPGSPYIPAHLRRNDTYEVTEQFTIPKGTTMEIKIETEWITTEKFAGEQLRAIVRGTYTNTDDDNATAVFVEFKNGSRTGKKGNNFAAYRISDFLDTFERVKRVNEIDDHRFPMMFTVDIWGYVSCRSINVEQDSGPYDVLAARAKISVVNGKLVFETLPTNPTQTKRTKQ